MSAFDLVWIFFMISALQPLLRQRFLEASRTRLIRELERRRRSRVIALIHRQETMSLLGFPLARYINIEDSEDVLRAIHLTDPDLPIDLIILHTPGGLVLAAEQIAHALVGHRAKVTVFVPHYAMSGGTLLALAADEIVMAPQWVLRRNGWEAERATAVAEALTEGRWTHDYAITVEQARDLGLSVTVEMPDEVYRFMGLFPQPTARRPSVEYVPIPYAAPPRSPGRRPA